MASSEKVFYSVFPIEGTVNDRGLILYVRESFFTASTTLVAGTTLENFMLSENPPKGDAITQGYGSYIYREQMSKEGNNLRFLFLKNKTPTEALQVVKPAVEINEVTYWPDWLLSHYALEVILEKEYETGTSGTTAITNSIQMKRPFALGWSPRIHWELAKKGWVANSINNFLPDFFSRNITFIKRLHLLTNFR